MNSRPKRPVKVMSDLFVTTGTDKDFARGYPKRIKAQKRGEQVCLKVKYHLKIVEHVFE